MSKTYTSKITTRTALPRSKRLRETGGTAGAATSSSVSMIINGDGGGDGHTHDNKAALDKISTTERGYINLTQLQEVGDAYEMRTEKVKAGYADVAYDLDLDSPVRSQFLSRVIPDTAEALIKFLNGSHFGNFVKGFSGGGIDHVGNAEFESITARSFLKVYELIYNRLNALEGNTSFADVGTVETAEPGARGESQVLTMRKRWEGDFTAFQVGDIIYGYVNNLDNVGAVEFYKSWGRVTGVDRDANALTVRLYPAAQTPAGVNHDFTAGMVIARWGNVIAPSAESAQEYSFIQPKGNGEYYNTRQSSFYISCDDGNLVELMGVDKPTLTAANYGAVLGRVPDGLLDAATAELLNPDQPYLYARGIVVQDLIRVNYNGVPVRTANYRGSWVEGETYHSTAADYDTVTHNESLWQCLTNGTREEPSADSADWAQMAGSGDIEVWRIVPSSSVVARRYNDLGGQVSSPETLSVTLLRTTKDGVTTVSTAAEASAAGVGVKYSIDGATERFYKFVPVLVGGASSAIHFEVLQGGVSLAMLDVPVVKDGAKGADGAMGLLAYPAGVYDAQTTYEVVGNATPVVLYNDNYYSLKRGATYHGASMANNRRNPALDVANGGTDTRWQRFDHYSAVYADIVMAEFAKLGSAVFYGDWMISQQGTIDGEPSGDYQRFMDGFEPNFCVNFRTGAMYAHTGQFSGYLRTSFVRLEESNAVQFGAARFNVYPEFAFKLVTDFNIHVSQFDEIVLPCNAMYIGARVMICENAHVYTRNPDYCTVYAENGTKIGGLLPRGESGSNIGSGGCQVVQFRDGLLEFVCVPGTTNNVEWVLMSGCAAELHGFNTTTT